MSDLGDNFSDSARDDGDLQEDEQINSDEDLNQQQDIDSRNSSQNDLDSEDQDNDDEDEEKDSDYGTDIINEDNKDLEEGKKQPNAVKITPAFLTKYEKARVIGVRALQISKNSPIYMVDVDKNDYDPIAIAEQEFLARKIPFIIRRYLPNKTFEDWPLNDLKRLD